MENDTREVQCWCLYCKDPIFDGDPIVNSDDNTYHPDCFTLIKKL